MNAVIIFLAIATQHVLADILKERVVETNTTYKYDITYDYTPVSEINIAQGIIVKRLTNGAGYKVIEVIRGSVVTGTVVTLYFDTNSLPWPLPEHAILFLKEYRSSIDPTDVWYQRLGPAKRSILPYSGEKWLTICNTAPELLTRTDPSEVLPADQAVKIAHEAAMQRYGAGAIIITNHDYKLSRTDYTWDVPVVMRVPVPEREKVYWEFFDLVIIDDEGKVVSYLPDRHDREVDEHGYSTDPILALMERHTVVDTNTAGLVAHEVICRSNSFLVVETGLEMNYGDLGEWWEPVQSASAHANPYVTWLHTLDPSRDYVLLKAIEDELGGGAWHNLWIVNAKNGIRFAIDYRTGNTPERR